MTEEELRIGALETWAIAVSAVLSPGQMRAVEDELREGLVGKGEPGWGSDEQTMRLGALQLLEDGKRRWDGFTGGVMIPKPRG